MKVIHPEWVLVKWWLYEEYSVVMMIFGYSLRWNKRQKCSGGRAPHCRQPSSSSSLFTAGCTGRPCRPSCSSAWWSCSVVGVSVRQILDPPTTLAGKGDRRGHQEAWLQTSSYWVRIWFVPHKMLCSSRDMCLYKVLWTLPFNVHSFTQKQVPEFTLGHRETFLPFFTCLYIQQIY